MTMHIMATFGCFWHYNAGKQSNVHMWWELKIGTVSLCNFDPCAPTRHAKQMYTHGWASLGAHKTK